MTTPPDRKIHVHTATDPGPVSLQPYTPEVAFGRRPSAFKPASPYLIDLPGAGVVRLTHVYIHDYRTDDHLGMDRVRVSYTLHPQTKALRDHNGRRVDAAEFYLEGARRMGREAFEDRIADAVRGILADQDRADAAAEAAAETARQQRIDLTTRASRLGVDLAWTRDGDPVLSPALLGVLLTVAEDAQ